MAGRLLAGRLEGVMAEDGLLRTVLYPYVGSGNSATFSSQ